jgi:hypothetical protein
MGHYSLLTGEYWEYPKGKRHPGLTEKIQRRLAAHFHDNFNFVVRLKGWGEKRGHLLYEVAWEITTYLDGRSEHPTEQQVRYFIDHWGSLGMGVTSEIVYDLRPTRKPPIEHPFGGFE